MTMMCLHTTEIVSAPSATPNGRAAASLTNVDSFFSFLFFFFYIFQTKPPATTTYRPYLYSTLPGSPIADGQTDRADNT
jgi:hypothetical protein